jgi:hypothetical protein
MIEKKQGGFVRKASPEKVAKRKREVRIRELIQNPKKNPTNADIQQLLLDIAQRQSEIYDMLKQRPWAPGSAE